MTRRIITGTATTIITARNTQRPPASKRKPHGTSTPPVPCP